MPRLNILLHDYAGHPFQAELSRELARRGHLVRHAYFAKDIGPKGGLSRRGGDPDTLDFTAIDIEGSYSKTSLIRRRFQDVAYGKAAASLIAELKPDVVISGNTPPEAQTSILEAARRQRSRFIFWCQDYYGIAAQKILAKKAPGVGHIVGVYYNALERAQMRAADAVILITEDFKTQALAWGCEPERLHVIPNWGAIEEIPSLPKDTAFAKKMGLSDKFVYLYTGTIGMKHNPGLLAAIAAHHQGDPRVMVLVAASGSGLEALHAEKAAHGLDNLQIIGLVPFDQYPEVLASADVLCSVIERDAGVYSVPSKVLSYLCAGRPILLAAPAENLAAKTVAGHRAGLVVDPEDQAAFLSAADALYRDEAMRAVMGRAGRAYAERHFPLPRIADQFEAMIAQTGFTPAGPEPVKG